MIKKLSFIASLLAFFYSAQAQVVGTESFDNTQFVPTGWTLKANTGTTSTQALWVRNTSSTFPTVTPHSGVGMARFRSRSSTSGAKQQMATRPIDYTNRGTNAANLTFWMYRDDQNANLDSIAVFVNNTDSIDANAVWLGTIARNRNTNLPDTQSVNGWYSYTFSIPNTFTGNISTRFIFEGSCENILGVNQGANMTIDDISFDEFPNLCNGIPNIGNIVSNVALICGGSGTANLSLSNAVSGAGVSYNWQESATASGPWTSFGANANTTTTNTISTKTYFMCIATCANSGLTYSTIVDSISVSANPLPNITVNPSPASFCAGTNGVTLSASGASTYAWSPALGLNAVTGTSVLASPSSNTQYTVVGTDSVGCANSSTVNVVIGSAPTISFTTNPSASVCIGNQVIINPVQGGGTNGYTYLWNDGKTSRRDTVTITATTTFVVTVTNQAGCSATDSIEIIALPAQNAGFSFVQSGNTFVFTDTTSGSIAWSWDFGDGNSSVNQNPTYTYSLPGSYTIRLIVEGPCKIDTITQQVEIYPLDIPNISNSSVNYCFPNPSSDYLNISLQNDEIQQVRIINTIGKSTKQNDYFDNNKLEILSIADLAPGFYSVQVKGKKGYYSMKFLKK